MATRVARGGMMGLAGRVDICGVWCDTLDADAIVHRIVDSAKRGVGGWVVTPNVDILRQALGDPSLIQLVDDATLVVVDGAPLVWAGKIARRPALHRAPGASLVKPVVQAAAAEGVPALLLGGRRGASGEAARRLMAEIPGARVFEHCPPLGFEHDALALNEVREAVRACSGGVVFCGFGFPRQERLMRELSRQFPDTWFLGVGGSIDFLAGYVPRAPLWLQRAGFEWVFRLAVEPRRLARRYLVEGIPFGARLMAWSLDERAHQRRSRSRESASGTAVSPDWRNVA